MVMRRIKFFSPDKGAKDPTYLSTSPSLSLSLSFSRLCVEHRRELQTKSRSSAIILRIIPRIYKNRRNCRIIISNYYFLSFFQTRISVFPLSFPILYFFLFFFFDFRVSFDTPDCNLVSKDNSIILLHPSVIFFFPTFANNRQLWDNRIFRPAYAYLE